MLFKPDDFDNPGFDTDFKSALPSADLLSDSTLDGGLSTSFSGLTGASLQRHLVELSATDALRAQQHVVRGLALTTGVLSHSAPTLHKALNGFDVRGTASESELADQLVSTAIGTATSVLSAIPTIYTQVAAAVLGLGQLLYGMFRTPKGQLPDHALPLQTYDDDTDAGHIHVHVNRALKDRDLTSLFLPRFEGSITVQTRKDEVGRYALAFGLGNGQVGEGAAFQPTGHLGFIPGGRRITSLVQTLLLEPPRKEGPPFFDPRCGGCEFSGGPKVVGRDVGSFYPSTNNAALTVWNHVMQVGPAMYEVDAVALQRAWQDHADAWGDGLAWLWNLGSQTSYWGTGMWRCALTEASRMQTVGIRKEIGALSWAPFDGCADLYPLGGFLDNSIYAGLADHASMSLWLAQHYYLQHTTIAAYLHPKVGSARNDPAMRAAIDDARRRILEGPEKYEVRKEDVVDSEYKAALREAGAFTPSFEQTFALNRTKRRRLTPAGLLLSETAPQPPKPPNPGGGSPLPTPPSVASPRSNTALALFTGLGASLLLVT